MRKIDEQLIASIFKVSRFMRETTSHDHTMSALTLLQMQALVYLKRNINAQMSEIAQEFHIELPSATSLINTLVKAQLVRRHTDEEDRRLVRVSLTNAGDNLLEKALEKKCQHMQRSLSYLSSKDKGQLLAILEKIVRHMEQEK